MHDGYFENCENCEDPPVLTPEQEKALIEINKLRQKVKVYISSPYTLGDVAVNVKIQMDAADDLMELGMMPFTPLYSHFQHMAHPRPYEQWLEIDKVWVLTSRIRPAGGAWSAGTTSSPVEITPIFGLRKTVTSVTPRAASRPISWLRIRFPLASAISPFL